MKTYLFTLSFLFPFALFSQQSDTLLLQNKLSIFFESDSFNLSTSHHENIDSFLGMNEGDTLLKIAIEAHTDSVGSIQYNQKLSERRAQSVLAFLSQKNIPFEYLDAQSLGELKPAASNKTEPGRQMNRRVDISIYRHKKWAWIRGQLLDDQDGSPISGFVLLRSKSMRDSTKTDSAGHFKLKGPVGDVVVIESNAVGHFFKNKTVKVTPGLLADSLKIEMPKAAIGRKFVVENLYFVGNQPTLLPASLPIIHRLLDFMKTNLDLCIRIDGHINLPNQGPVEKDTWHYELSDNRTKTVFNFLKEHGIDERRMQRKAFGNWEMVFPNAKEEDKMRKNRRVEIFIIDCIE